MQCLSHLHPVFWTVPFSSSLFQPPFTAWYNNPTKMVQRFLTYLVILGNCYICKRQLQHLRHTAHIRSQYVYLDASLKSRSSCDLLWLFGHIFHSHDLQQIPLGYVLIGWLNVINLHVLAAVQAAFAAHAADLVAQGSLFCYRLFCHHL